MAAVKVVNGRLVFGQESLGVQNASLTVSKGTIYALLGPSGCGKTTLLTAVVGLRRLQSGKVFIYGHQPHTKDSGVPGPWLGFMPQEMCLCAELTVKETLRYFGLLHCLARKELRKRIGFLTRLLELPMEQMAGTMSGGQKRRLSLAVAMIHDPPLIILDEPTVGVDPLLRTIIWNHLLELANGQSKTVLITTHYIEEASAAHMVGFMRDGCVLEQKSPRDAMMKYHSGTLEEVFLNLCLSVDSKKDDQLSQPSCSTKPPSAISKLSRRSRVAPGEDADKKIKEKTSKHGVPGEQNVRRSGGTSREKPGTSSPIPEKDEDNDEDEFIPIELFTRAKTAPPRQTRLKEREIQNILLPSTSKESKNRTALPKLKGFWISTFTKIYAITWKNALVTRRNIVLLVIAFLTPVNNLLMVKFLLFKSLYGIPVGVVNNDDPPTMSEMLVKDLDRTTLDVKFFDRLEVARHLQAQFVLKGVIHIRPEFSTSLLKRAQEGIKTENSTIDKTFIHVYLDRGNLELERTIFTSLLESFAKFGEEYVDILGVEKTVSHSPLTFEHPIVGKEKPELSEYVTMNMMPDSLFIMSLAFTVLVFMGDIASGVHDRGYVSGVKNFQDLKIYNFAIGTFVIQWLFSLMIIFVVVVSHALIHTFVTTVQMVFLAVFLVSFSYDIKGSYFLLFFLLYQASYLGMALGVFMVSLNCKVSNAVLAVITVYWYSCAFTGIMWPTESIISPISLISQIHPCTSNYRAVRYVAYKGLGLRSRFIWPSVLIAMAWTAGLLSVSLLLLQRDKKNFCPRWLRGKNERQQGTEEKKPKSYLVEKY